MLQVPTLKPNQEPFDPTRTITTLPKIGTHSLPIPQNPAYPTETPDPTPTQILDHTLVKEAITTLHIEDDEQTQKLLAYPNTQLNDIIPHYLKFTKSQKEKFTALLKSNTQRHIFEQSTHPYFTLALPRAQSFLNSRIHQFQQETIHRQNQEFISRALRPENIMNDHLQTQYRDMILHNIELLLTDAPPQERQNTLNTASKELYTKIMDKRLTLDPESLTPLLASPAVQHALGKDELSTYRHTMTKAVLRNKLAWKARTWVDQYITPAEAKTMASAQYPDPETQTTLLTLYASNRHNFFRKQYLKTILDAENAWKTLKHADFNPAAIPDWVKNGDQPLFDFISTLLTERDQNGGANPTPDYRYTLRFIKNFNPQKSAESLAKPETTYQLIQKAGGFDSPLFTAILRLLLGKLTQPERNLFDCLLQAQDELTASYGADIPLEKSNTFLSACAAVRQRYLRKNNCTELDPLEMQDIISQCLELIK